MRAIIWSIAFLWCSLPAVATHLIGGELYYTSLGNSDYEVTVKVYRDCNPATNTNGQGFDPSVEVAAYLANGTYFGSIFIPLDGESALPVTLNSPCLTPPSDICVEEGVYTGVINLPAGTGGYTLAYQRCCRSPIVGNLFNPNTQGLTCTANVPDVANTGENSSPRFSQIPPIALCVNQPMSFDNVATDPDGDVLVYDLCAPFTGGSQFDPIPAPPTGPPYSTVTWGAGYSVANMVDASPPLNVDAGTGFVTLTPTLIGSYTLGVRVREFRNGIELSSVIRDFRLDIVPCAVAVISAIADQEPATLCAGLELSFENNSSNGDFFHWDFGVAGTAADTSSEEEPTFLFPASGTYPVVLIANPGWPCADTATNSFTVSNPVTVQFAAPPIICFDEQPMTLAATGAFTPAASVAWNLGTGSAPDSDQHITHPSFPDNGSFAVTVTVTENGCTNSFTDSVRVHPRPIVQFTSDTAGCIPLDVPFTNLSSAWTPMSFLWQFGDGSSSTEVSPVHSYSTEGFHTVSLTASTNSGCIATRSLVREDLVQVWPQPRASFVVDPPVADLLSPTVFVQDNSLNAYHWHFDIAGEEVDTTAFTYTFQEAGWFPVRLIAISGLGCADTAVVPVFVGGHFFYAPTAFTPDGDGINEAWRPSVKGARLYRLDVFDRWGQNIFSTEDPNEWMEVGALPIGTYAYKAWISEWGPLEKEYNGSFQLIR